MRTLVILFLLLRVSALAQTTRTTLSGRVSDDQGFAISSVRITLKDLSKGTSYGCVSNSQGGYQIAGILPGGPYRLQAFSVGLKPFLCDELYFSLTQPKEINIILQSATIALADVNISAFKTWQINNADLAASAIQIDQNKIQMLPSLRRSLADFIRLDASANGWAIGGGNFRQNFITVDGSEFNNNFGIGDNLPGNGSSPIALDAIAQVSLSSAPYDAIWESGFIGSAVNIITRSGTNELQGSAYSFFRSPEVFPGNFSATSKTRAINYSLSGISLGGPVKKDKLFYFISLEREREIYQAQPYQASSAAQPYGSEANLARPSTQELDQISSYLLSRYNYATGDYQNYEFSPSSNRLLARIDWNIARNNTLAIRYNQLSAERPELLNGSRSPLTPFSASAGRRGINSLSFENANFTTHSKFYSLSAEWDFRISKTLSNALRASFTAQREYRSSNSTLFPFVDILKDEIPFTSFGYEPFSVNNKRSVSLFSLSNILRWKPGKNSWAAGFQGDYMKTGNSYMPFAAGYYTYASWQDFVMGAKPQDYAVSFVPSGLDKNPSYSFDYLNISAFAQHSIHAAKSLKIDAGIRADIALYPKDLADNPAIAALSFAGGEKLSTAFLPRPALLLSPRLSFQYDLLGENELMLKGGTGIFTGRIPSVWVISQARYSGVNQISQTWQTQTNTPITFDADPSQQSVPRSSASLPSILSVLSRDFKMPQSWKSGISLQGQLAKEWTGSIGFNYNREIRGISFRDLNLVSPKPLNIAGYADHRLVYPQLNSEKYLNPLNAKGERDAGGNSAMNVVSIINSSKGYYFSSMINLSRKSASGFDFSITYLQSKAKNFHDGEGDQTLSALNSTASVSGINDLSLADASFVMPHRVVSSAILPVSLSSKTKINIGLFYQGSAEGRFSYTYGRDFTGDGANRSLIYIPKDPSEINFAPIISSGLTNIVLFSALDQQQAFFAYIAQDKYLSKRGGRYAQRNGAIMPWRHQVDLKISVDFLLQKSARKNSLSFSADMLNLGNLLYREWGVRKLVNASSILIPVNLEQVSAGATPSFQLARIAGKLVEETFRKDYSLNSSYFIQLGVRYSF